MRIRDMEDVVRIDENGYIITPEAGTAPAQLSADLAPTASYDMSSPTSDNRILGSLSGTEEGDLINITLKAGQTYTFAYRGTESGGIEDPYLALYSPTGSLITVDDDGGLGRSSMITFTPTADGVYQLFATSFYTIDGESPSRDTGNYTIDVWSPKPELDAPSTIASTFTLTQGVNFGNIDVAGDRDVYRIDMKAGNVYNFTYNGGIYNGADFNNEPGENLAYLQVLNSAGTVIAQAVNYETLLTYIAPSDGTYYLRTIPYTNSMTGGYTIDYSVRPFSSYDPLEALDWDSAPNVPFADTDGDGKGDTAYIYFTSEGENLGFLQGEPGSSEPMLSFGFNAFEQQAILDALNNEYGFLLGINYVTTTDIDQATFKLILTEDEPYGARFLNYAPNYGTQAGTGIFVRDNAGWSYQQQQSLLEGGFDYALILHEFGHAHGIAHPHDTGGGSEIMLGVTGAQNSLGLFDLNQGVYTVMSYNDGWDLNPAGPSPLFGSTVDNGWSGSMGAFDIAVLQARYGLAERNTGDNVYSLADNANDAFYETIWDSAGVDTIAYDGARDARIDLTAATLDYSPTGGGVISYIINEAGVADAARIRGGFTIANGVVIENATGGSGNDVLIGNDAANVLRGNAGNDVLMGRGGNDLIIAGAGNDRVHGGDGLDVVQLGAGNDVFVAEVTASKINVGGPNKGLMSVDIITDFKAEGSDLIDLSGLGSFNWRGTDANKRAGDLSIKTFDSVNAAEKVLGFDIDGNPGANTGSPVTVVYGNTDGGAADFAIVLLNTASVNSSDFIVSAAAKAAMVGSENYNLSYSTTSVDQGDGFLMI